MAPSRYCRAVPPGAAGTGRRARLGACACLVLLLALILTGCGGARDAQTAGQPAEAGPGRAAPDQGIDVEAFASGPMPVPPPAQEAPAGGVWDLGECVQRALEANPRLTQARQGLLGARHGRQAALSDFGFQVNAVYKYEKLDEEPRFGAQETWTATLNLTQPVFTGFRLLSAYQKAGLSVDRAEASVDQAELSMILAVQNAFFGVLKARKDLASARDQVSRIESQYQVTKAFHEVGLRPRLDLLQAEVQLAQAQRNLVVRRNNLETAVTGLNTLLALPVTADTEYEGELAYRPFSLTLQQCLAIAYRNRPDLIMAAKSVAIASEDSDMAASGYWPQVDAEFNYYRMGEDPDVSGGENITDEDGWSAGATMNWNLFEWGGTYRNHQAARANVAAVRAEAADTRLEAGREVKSNFLSLKAAEESIQVSRKALAAAREGYRMAKARYENQVGTNTDVLDALADVTNAEAGMTQALADYQLALASLYVSMGRKNPGLISN